MPTYARTAAAQYTKVDDPHMQSGSFSPDPEIDESFLKAHYALVYLVTINLERSEDLYNNTSTVFQFLFPRNFRIVKHWGILVRDTVYELARDQSNSGSGVKLSTTSWQDVRTNFDAPVEIGRTGLSDGEILKIAEARFSNWPKHGYSLTFSNCQCFCYRLSWYICEETRSHRGKLYSKYLPTRLAIIQAYLLCIITTAIGIGWAVRLREFWWPLGWGTLVAAIYELSLCFMIQIFYQDKEALGGWNGSERRVLEPIHQFGAHTLGLGILPTFAYGPPCYFGFMKQVNGHIKSSSIL
ncbi:hypothetical protein N431DRAFT_562856 [Stipitochalara longipes BDJ]|nr:hypothetical protein N431DRAFT_562856 [Stipitochalara longipes BDJ]